MAQTLTLKENLKGVCQWGSNQLLTVVRHGYTYWENITNDNNTEIRIFKKKKIVQGTMVQKGLGDENIAIQEEKLSVDTTTYRFRIH